MLVDLVTVFLAAEVEVRVKCRNCVIDYSMIVGQHFDNDMASKNDARLMGIELSQYTHCSMPSLASFFDAMFGFKKLTYFHAVITYITLAFIASNEGLCK